MVLQGVLDQAELFKLHHPFLLVGIMYGSFLVNAIFILPLFSVLGLLFALVIDDFAMSAMLLAALPILVSVTMYFSISNRVIPHLRTKLQRFQIFKHLDHTIDASSYAVCLVIRFLYVPVGLKEYMLLVLRYPFRANLLSAVVFYTVHGIIFAGVGSQLYNINDMFKKNYWSDMSLQQKADLVLVLISATFTISVFIYITYWLRTRVMVDNNIDLTSAEGDENKEQEDEERKRLMNEF